MSTSHDSDSARRLSAAPPASLLRRLTHAAFVPVSNESLAVFRIVFGFCVLLDATWFLRYGWIDTAFIQPPFLFKYYLFEWVHPWPGQGMYLHFVALVILAACITLGLCYRVSCLLFAIGITWVFLLEKAIYLNHMYLICLISWLMIFVPCHRAWSLDALRLPELRSSTVPAWALWLIRFQVGIPYFFGGIAKMEMDWFRGDTVTMFFLDDTNRPIIGPWMLSDPVIMTVTWGGLLFDLCVVPCLLWKQTRVPAFIVAVLFHLSNAMLFNIGIFPWMMIGATTIFFRPDWPRRLLRLPAVTGVTNSLKTPKSQQHVTVVLLGLYMTIQILLPFRQFMYPGNPSWTDEGHSFCWRMMLRRKLTDTKIMAVDQSTGRKGRIPLEQFLTPRQIRNMSRSPDMLLQFSHFLERTLIDEFGYKDVAIHAAVKVSMNGRKAQFLVDPTVDLTKQERSLRHKEWIMPLTAPTLSQFRKQLDIESATAGNTME